jgi:two-component system chemotaxis sensor kinase CheA
MDDPFKYFRIEAHELTDELSKGVLELERGAPTSLVVARLLRLAHTLKGAARVVKQPEIADRAHALEDTLGPFRESTAPVPPERLGLLLELVDEMVTRIPTLAAPDGDHPGHDRRDSSATSGSVPGSAPGSIAPVPVDNSLRTVRVEVEDVDALLSYLAEAHASLGSLRAGADLNDSIERIERELRQAREAAERLRLVPAASMFADLDRAARDVARAQDKRVVFEGRGGALRLDASVVAAAQSALQQIVRNAVAHGIESPSERRIKGKSPQGQVLLDVTRRGRRVVFSCRDDGRGVDLDAVRMAVRAKGSIGVPAARIGGLNQEQLLALLLDGGISTSRTVTEVSGRGIGLDVARDAAVRLSGKITMASQLGTGTTVELVAPLSLSALDVLMVEAGDGPMALPLDAVRQTLRVGSDEIAASGGQGDSLLHGGTAVPFLPLASALGEDTPYPTSRAAWSVVIVKGRAGAAAIGVHRLLGVATVAIRPLPETVSTSTAVSGVWIDADGAARLVLEPEGLVAEARRGRTSVLSEGRPQLSILIIDDSLTTRMLEQSILESAGYDVDVASSGEEALRMAAGKHYSLFLVDVEMPGMDGFTFIERVRATPELHDLPCILVTSLAGPEHRRRGLEAGAQAYIAKSEFDQAELLAQVRQLTVG